MYSEGSAHGRFQPLHNGHLRYLLEAKKRCKFLWVGITQYNVHSLNDSPKERHRQKRIHNPLTFFERVLIIKQALLDNHVRHDEFGIIPFPFDTPEYLNNFLPKSIPIFTVVCDEWNEHKIEVLKQEGYKVITLWKELDRDVIGMQIREDIRMGKQSWKENVPAATVDIMEKYHIDRRIQAFTAEDM